MPANRRQIELVLARMDGAQDSLPADWNEIWDGFVVCLATLVANRMSVLAEDDVLTLVGIGGAMLRHHGETETARAMGEMLQKPEGSV